MLKLVIFVSCVAAVVFAQSPSFGGCPTVPSQSTFNLTRYLGDWYEMYVFPTHFEKGSCTRAHYTVKDDGHIEVFNRGIENGTEVRAIGDAYCPDPAHPAELLVRFAAGTPYGNYWVIDTDYDSYTLIYSCESILGVAHIEFDHLMKELAGYGVDVSKFKESDQANCPP
ncbi:hypothetical protein BaRGS_00025491 [Batillaria attramentaria]|uniref:Apolipoprotein D n=1 Tax=Batillaria attramentaria TaxID=370345 RepID=A0ABD0K8A8_9CAEN